MPRMVMTVLGPVSPQEMGITDAHSHVWIEPVPGAYSGAPRLDDEAAIAQELRRYRQAGGGGIVDCQPGGCGRNGNMLARLGKASGVHLVACTGFHRRPYYGTQADLWEWTAVRAADYFIHEIRRGLTETQSCPQIGFPGFIKIAAEATLAATRRELLEAAVHASRETGYAIQMHTEKGAAVEDFLRFFIEQGLAPQRLIFCHIDKRPDFGLHKELAAAGVLLEYDTFYRPKYRPQKYAWPLIKAMVQAGYESHLALATDMAERTLWQHLGGHPGLVAFLCQVKPRLEQMGLDKETKHKLLGKNVAERLAVPFANEKEAR